MVEVSAQVHDQSLQEPDHLKKPKKVTVFE